MYEIMFLDTIRQKKVFPGQVDHSGGQEISSDVVRDSGPSPGCTQSQSSAADRHALIVCCRQPCACFQHVCFRRPNVLWEPSSHDRADRCMNLQQITQQQNLDRPKTHKLRDVYKRAGLQRSLAGQRDRIRRLTRTWTRAVTTQHFILSIILGIRAVTAHDIVLNIVPSGYLAG